ncbi:hypothetical protein LEP1GSC047_4215 [Leptospira inadai serovar Lyme str. 10]|uniref:Uncharacterized protein n=1 Tax=Leptospira inadai serovar Lyme str. 10 TaxID=1049790 RepID=V6HDW4_9LEPT|nr:hypothetical protein LEP1GSC047_4215 [Leptospira inadai serovar Lyme str. 10]
MRGRQRTEDRGQRTEDRGQRTEDRGQRTEDRGQRTEDRGQRTEDRGQKIIPITLTTIFLKTNYVGTPTPRKRAEEKSNVRGVSVFYRKILAL